MRFFRKHYGDRAAWLLSYKFTALPRSKPLFTGLLRLISGGRYGRPVVSLRYLAMELEKA